MQIDEAIPAAEFFEAAPADALRLIAPPGGTSSAAALLSAGNRGKACYLAVGPEGGFTDEESALATAAGWQPVSLGARTLRVETAALMLAALAAGTS
jgi:16S rRNA (uracil1498-N3)-methyltransferase